MEIPHIMELLVSEYTRKEKKCILYCTAWHIYLYGYLFSLSAGEGGGGKNSKDFGRHILILL